MTSQGEQLQVENKSMLYLLFNLASQGPWNHGSLLDYHQRNDWFHEPWNPNIRLSVLNQ